MKFYTPLPDSALDNFSTVISDKKPKFILDGEKKSLLIEACKRIFCELDMEVKLDLKEELSIAKISRAAKCQYRIVKLSGSWWKSDNGVLLAFHNKTKRPCVLLPKKRGGYFLFDPGDGSYINLDANIASVLSLSAYLFYKPFSDSRITLRCLLSFALKPQRNEIFHIVFYQFILLLLGLIVPVSMGYLFETVVPNTEINLLWQLIIGLTVATFSMSIFGILQAIALLRLKFKVTFSVQSAVWDRLLKLPVSFFRKFTAGDLADRSSGIDAMQAKITGIVIKTFLSGIFSLMTLALMFYYSWLLTLVAIVLLVITSTVIIFFNIIQLGYQRKNYEINGRLKGFMLQLLTAISKLRISNKEKEAYEKWSSRFSEKMNILYRSGKLSYYLDIFRVFFTIINLIIIFYIVILQGNKLSFGQFITFNAAYGQFLAGFFALTGVVVDLMGIIPLYERIKPILQEVPEDLRANSDMPDIQGSIDIQRIFFTYGNKKDSPLVLKDVSIKINSGQFIAIVGGSGSGKSTLLRLLLGFEKLMSGHIFYDGYDLSILNPVRLREKIGVVMQNQMLLPGTILENIADFGELTEEEAWNLAKVVAIDEDIANMPMQMNTQMSQSGRTLSLGQRQRILLARALAHQPKLLLLDEATSALDNQTQKQIYENLIKLPVTKIVTAHRLSTIVSADKIYVLDNGAIVEQGNYNELIFSSGVFSNLVKRQLS